MAIPLSNEMREVQAPRTAELKPIDNQQFLQSMGNAALGMNRQMQETIRVGFKVAQQIRDQQDAFKRNEAERIYNERTTELNTQLAQKQGEERVKFQPKYEAEMKLASDTYEAAINKVHNFEIREGSKRSINAWNNRNASNYQYENYKNETKLQEQAMGQAIITDNEKRINSITAADSAKSLAAYANDPNLGFSHGEELIREFYGGRMGMPKEVVDQYVKDYKTKGAIAMANRLAQVTDDVSSTASYNQALGFLDQGIKEGWISAPEGIEAKRALEAQKIDMVAAIEPGTLVNLDGTYNFNAARRYAPDLTQKELYQHISASKGKGAGNAMAGVAQEQISQVALDNWNALTLKLGRASTYGTDDFVEQNTDQIARTKPASNKEILDLIELYTFGQNLLNGVAVVNEDGTYTDPKTGVTTQTAATGVKRILDKQTHSKLQEKFNKVEADIANMVSTGQFRTIFNPTVMKQSRMLDDQSRAYLAQLQVLMQSKGGPSDGWFSRGQETIGRMLHLKDYEATKVVTIPEIRSALNGVQQGMAEAGRKYGFDPSYAGDDLQMRRPVFLKQYNAEKGTYENIPNIPMTNMKTALEMEIGFATLQEMDDGMFQSIYGPMAKKPTNVAEMPAYGGYEMDFNGEDKKTSIANKLNYVLSSHGLSKDVANTMFPGIRLGDAVSWLHKSLGVPQPNFSFTDAEVYSALSKTGKALKEALKYTNTTYSEIQMPDGRFQDMQILDKVFSGKPDNEPLTYEEFTVVNGAATPSEYNGYLVENAKYTGTINDILSVNAFNKDNPAQYFITEKPESMRVLDDMYAKANGQAPSNPKYIGEDIPVSDVFDAGGVHSFNAPQIAFGEAKVSENQFEASMIRSDSPMFFVSPNSSYGYILRNNQIKKIDCNAFEFVSLLGIAKKTQENMAGRVTTVTRGTIPPNMISNQFK